MKNFLDLDAFKNLKKSAGRTIKAFRHNFEISLEKLALDSGVSSADITALENETAQITPDQAAKIGKAIGLDPEFLLFP
jgi:plasmid maintenance system antidote protein VapI